MMATTTDVEQRHTADEAHPAHTGHGRWPFARHYLEMVAAMFVGMAVLGGLVHGALALAGLGIVLAPWLYRSRTALNQARAEKVRADARADMAAHLHDSVLQTLALIQRQADVMRHQIDEYMAAGMTVWMRYRGHGWPATLEMSGAMFVPALALFPLLWAGALSGDDLLMLEHVLMLPLMYVVMLRRRSEYGG